MKRRVVKRLLALSLVSAMTVTGLAACGGGDSSSGSGADRKPVAAGTENLWKLYVACAGKGRYCTGSPV